MLEPTYQVPSRKAVKAILMVMHKVMGHVKSVELANVDHVSLTLDFWSSAAMESYLGVTIHYISDAWLLESRVLQVRQMLGQHSGANIAPRSYVALWRSGTLRLNWLEYVLTM